MMPYFFDWRHSGCLIILPEHLAAGLPRFQLGQRVKSHFTDEHGVYRGCDRGVVVGMSMLHYHASREPLYMILWLEMPTAPWLALPSLQEELESYLEAD